ncbi:tRNA (guanine-N(7)-)-methyltransferase non-catalytic subunit trm82 [Malassezia sp. CBS 17886]|nr:tRNA (guanine-N(7)-)-methyltransferase non-catalytic subunit trm82 [Malassezia sp. CBS 17886]
MSAHARLPVHAVDASSQYLVALTGANIILFCGCTGAELASLPAHIDAGASVPRDSAEAAWAAFPRLCAIAPSQAYVAVASDDKTLRVWRTDAVEYGKELLVRSLGKRAGTMQWVPYARPDGTLGDEVVVADKFGDVWSFPVDEDAGAGVPEAAGTVVPPAADDPAEAAVPPRLGHVSMITCVAFMDEDERGVPSTVITCDRDEHIRLSRWGRRRAGHVIQSYLLGSHAFVGALAVVPSAVADAAGIPSHDHPVIVSSDGGACLRVWCHSGAHYALYHTVHLDEPVLAANVSIDADVEMRRERVAGNLAFRGEFNPTESLSPNKRANGDVDAPALPTPSPAKVCAITRLRLLCHGGSAWLVFTLDGVGSPILSFALVQNGPDVAPYVWVSCDDRPGVGVGPALHTYTFQASEFVPRRLDVPAPLSELVGTAPPCALPDVVEPVPLAQGTPVAAVCAPRSVASRNTLSKLCLYPALTTWPKPPPQPGHDAPQPTYLLGQRSDHVAQEMVHRFQSGKRAAGRAKNQAVIQQHFDRPT